MVGTRPPCGRFVPNRGRQRMKRRLDQLLVDRGLAESRSRAQALVMAGLVFSGERRLDKAGLQVPEDIAIEMRGQDHPWVSRGGLKLEHALDAFALDPDGEVGRDVGASQRGSEDGGGRGGK